MNRAPMLQLACIAATLGVVAVIGPFAAHAAAEGFLEGTFYVRCVNGHDDKIENFTRNHDCEKCGKKSVDSGTAIVVCPIGHAGEENKVEGITRQHQCQTRVGDGICGKQCRR